MYVCYIDWGYGVSGMVMFIRCGWIMGMENKTVGVMIGSYM